MPNKKIKTMEEVEEQWKKVKKAKKKRKKKALRKKKHQQKKDAFYANAEQVKFYHGVCEGNNKDIQECVALHEAVANSPLGIEMNLSNPIIGVITELARGCIAVCHQCGVDACLTYHDTKKMANESTLKYPEERWYNAWWLDAEEFDGYFEERLGKSQSIFYCKECIPAMRNDVGYCHRCGMGLVGKSLMDSIPAWGPYPEMPAKFYHDSCAWAKPDIYALQAERYPIIREKSPSM